MTHFAGRNAPPKPDDSRVPLILGVETSLVILSLILYGLRMYSRCRPARKLWWDDLFITFAIILSVASYIVALLSITVGYGRHTSYLPRANVVTFGHLALIAEPLWVWEVTFIKISVAFMFLRLSRTVTWQKTWKFLMCFSIFYLFASAIIVLCLQLTECTPLRFFWDRSLEGHCRSPHEVKIGIIATSAVFAFSDFQFSLLPLTFVLKLNRPVRERVAVGCIMGLGLLASIIGCLKFIGFNNLRSNPDVTWVMVPWKLGSFAEASIGIIAANIPPLKSRGEQMLRTLTASMSSASGSASVDGTTLFERGNKRAMASDCAQNSSKEEEDIALAGIGQPPESLKAPEVKVLEIEQL